MRYRGALPDGQHPELLAACCAGLDARSKRFILLGHAWAGELVELPGHIELQLARGIGRGVGDVARVGWKGNGNVSEVIDFHTRGDRYRRHLRDLPGPLTNNMAAEESGLLTR